jgi:hypothetical protein
LWKQILNVHFRPIGALLFKSRHQTVILYYG